MRTRRKLQKSRTKLSLGSNFRIQSYSPVTSEHLAFKQNLSLSRSCTLASGVSQDSLRMQEAYQFLRLRDVGCSRKQAISLASKFKLNKINYLSSLPQDYRQRLIKTLDDEKYQVFNSSDDDLDYANLNEMLKKIRDKRKNEKKSDQRMSGRINLKIFNRNFSQKRTLEQTGNSSSEDKNLEKVRFFEKNFSIDSDSEPRKKDGQQRNLRKVRKDFFSIRRNSLQSPVESEDENYLELLANEKDLKNRIQKHKLLLAEIKKHQIDEKNKNQDQKRLKNFTEIRPKHEKNQKISRSSKDLILPQMLRK